jgi:Protein of unknown function (DUF2568)
MRPLILLVRFLLELAMLAALAWWGATVGEGPWLWVLGIGAPLAAAVVWGTYVAPKARHPLPVRGRVSVESLLYLAAGFGLAQIGHDALGFAFFALAVVVANLNAITEGHPAG